MSHILSTTTMMRTILPPFLGFPTVANNQPQGGGSRVGLCPSWSLVSKYWKRNSFDNTIDLTYTTALRCAKSIKTQHRLNLPTKCARNATSEFFYIALQCLIYLLFIFTMLSPFFYCIVSITIPKDDNSNNNKTKNLINEIMLRKLFAVISHNKRVSCPLPN